MTLPVPYIVYGTIKDINSNNLSSVNVEVSGSSSETSASDTTGADGKYSVNIQDHATDGDTITVTASRSGHSASDTFALTLGESPTTEKDITLDVRNLRVSIVKTPTGRVSINKVPNKKVYINKN